MACSIMPELSQTVCYDVNPGILPTALATRHAQHFPGAKGLGSPYAGAVIALLSLFPVSVHL